MHLRFESAALLALMFTSAFLPCAACAQSSQPSAVLPSSTSVRSNVQEVSLYLVVDDARHRPITDLRPEDFTVTDNGQLVSLTSLRLAFNDEHLITFVFDRLSPAAAQVARSIANRFLSLDLGKNASIAVMVASGRLMLLAPYTSDHAALAHAFDMATTDAMSDEEAAVTAAEKQALADAQSNHDNARTLIVALQQSLELVQSTHTAPILAELTALARAESHLPGRKSIVYFSRGLGNELKTRGNIVSVIDEANRAGVSIFPIDVNAIDARAGKKLLSLMGVVSPTPSVSTAIASNTTSAPNLGNTSDIAPKGVTMAANEEAGRLEFSGHDVVWNWNPLSDLATGTGGIYVGTNPSGTTSDGLSIDKQLAALRDNMTSYYEATYTPSIAHYDGQFRPIAVRTRRHGITIHTRTGYVAVPPNTDAPLGNDEQALFKLFDQPQLPTGLTLRSACLRLGSLAGENTSELVVEAPVSALETHDDPNTGLSSIHALLAAQIRDSHGNIVQHFTEDIARRGASSALHSDPAAAVTLQRHFALPPGNYTLEAAIRDANNGKTSAQRTSFHIDEPASGLSLGQLILVRYTTPLPTDGDAFEPLRFNQSRVVPAVGPDLPSASAPLSLFVLAAPDAHSTDPVDLRLSLYRDGDLVGQAPIETPQLAANGSLPVLTTIKAGALPPGSYKAVITLTQGRQSASTGADFILPGSAPAPSEASSSAPATPVPTPAQPTLAIERTETATRPSDAEIAQWIETARTHAVDYSNALPNFFCVETTSRSVEADPRTGWKHQDTIVELVQYRDHREQRTPVEINGQKTTTAHENLSGVKSIGEFGGVLRAIFAPSAAAAFQWKETDMLEGTPLQVFSYSVPRASSSFSLNGADNRQLIVGYHGLVYIDTASGGVHRLTMEADDLPADFSIGAAAFAIEYNYVSINSHDYLMPAHGSMSLRSGKNRAVLNEFDFRDYRRFGSRTRIIPANN